MVKPNEAHKKPLKEEGLLKTSGLCDGLQLRWLTLTGDTRSLLRGMNRPKTCRFSSVESPVFLARAFTLDDL